MRLTLTYLKWFAISFVVIGAFFSAAYSFMDWQLHGAWEATSLRVLWFTFASIVPLHPVVIEYLDAHLNQ